ncbi:amylo-alpha-1,6-glucosidase [Nibrella viscosa]|uniref:Amylo-alpha-1,6-glucosidase n=1 Tax=Nibrella viscosa TaxID=1084524 RepID=A0ABP8KUM8_9BACT
MKLSFDQTITRQSGEASRREWLETNGLGGWAGSTLSGTHTRRYHGLLVAATNPPVGRQVLLSKLDETLRINGETYELGTNQYPGAVYPQGYLHLMQFRKTLFPEFVYQAGGVTLRKTIAAVNGENTTLVTYEVLEAPSPFSLEWLPLVAGRDYHSMMHVNGDVQMGNLIGDGVLHIQPYADSANLFISIPGAAFHEQADWYYNLEYAIEQYRGLDFREDLFSPGRFSLELREGDKVGIIVSTESPLGRNAFALLDKERRRREMLLDNQPVKNDWITTLTLAADQFVVKRGDNLKTIIAGYHWFSDWGRDTMIALPGICLTTGRFDDAKNILRAFAQSVSEGMLPNRFPDYGEAPEYNTIDATLWFFVAIYQYRQFTHDGVFVRDEMLPVLHDMLDWHFRGTRYQIHVDTDGLLYGGVPGQQLTWMDARVGDWVVTPRQGKAVEVNALWYNALRIFAELARDFGQGELALQMALKADLAIESFNRQFWNPEKSCLYDYIDGDYRNDNIRPNQLLAISLPFPLLTMDKARKVLQVVEKTLYTPVGLRSLSPDHVEYKPVYGGDQWHRDGAYHQGTVWSWWLGPYIDALVNVKGRQMGTRQARQVLDNLAYHLNEAGIGTISEIFDGAAPHSPRGCIAQAWGVGELLRVIRVHQLFDSPVAETLQPVQP